MANLIKPPLLDETGKAILAALLGEEPAEQSGSQIRPPMSDETGKAILEAIKALSPQPAPLVVTFSGTTEDSNATCDKTWSEIQSAITAGRQVVAQYSAFGILFQLVSYYSNGNSVRAVYLDIPDPTTPDDGFTSITCQINYLNSVICYYTEH